MKKYLLLLMFIAVGFVSRAQVTSSKIVGYVYDDKGPVAGATVVAVHVPSGTEAATFTLDNGAFTLPNLRVGGPYTVKITFMGYKPVTIKDIYLELGSAYNLKVKLEKQSVELGEVVVQADKNAVFSADRTGAETNIDSRIITSLPSISRSAEDFYRLDPTASGNSFAGRNDQYNNFSLDGSIFNNPYGLDAATPGGQSNAQPISLEAIDQIQVEVAPYDVTQSGFTGAVINAVTKSGTNEFHGAVFGYYRNKYMTGKVYLGETTLRPELSQNQTGFSFGGPIKKNKLFFFINFERDDRYDLGSYYVASRPGLTGDNVSRVTAEDLDRVSAALATLGYETGPYENYLHRTYSDKGIVKLDWNAFKGTRVSFIYNYLHAYRDLNAHPDAIMHRGPDRTVLQFYNSGYRINNNINSALVEVNSILPGSKMSNKFQLGFTYFNDFRNPFSTPAPVINIFEDGQPYIVAGHEPFSIHNYLKQYVTQFQDVFTYYMDKHTITAGVAFEKFDFTNSFNLFGYGFDLFYAYPSVDAFIDSVNSGYVQSRFDAAQAAEEAGQWNITRVSVGQYSVFLQDAWAINDRLTLTYGLRVDVPSYFNTPEYIEQKIEEAGSDYIAEQVTWYDQDGNEVKLSARDLPPSKPRYAPRFGFNWDVLGNGKLQLRGGSGVFNGRLPFVWIGNHVANVGRWYFTPIAPNFQFPQVWRSSLGVDYKFANGMILSVDGSFTKDINAMMVRDYGLKPPSGTLNSPIDQRAVYTDNDHAIMPDYGIPADAYVFTNTPIGYSYFFTVKLQKRISTSLDASIAYNFMNAYDANSIEAEITGDAWMRNPALGNVNDAVLAHSLYGDKHRVVGYLTKNWVYGHGKKWNTLVSAYFEAAQGGRFSYTYSGDINGDGSALNDLIYIPTESELQQMTFTGDAAEQDAQRAALNQFILQDPYLSTHRGEYMERYAILSPWRSRIDVKFLQAFNYGDKGKRIEFTVNIMNFANMLNKNWGVIQLPTNRQPIGVYIDSATGEPVYSFDTGLTSTFYNDYSLASRWQMQVGLRIAF